MTEGSVSGPDPGFWSGLMRSDILHVIQTLAHLWSLLDLMWIHVVGFWTFLVRMWIQTLIQIQGTGLCSLLMWVVVDGFWSLMQTQASALVWNQILSLLFDLI